MCNASAFSFSTGLKMKLAVTADGNRVIEVSMFEFLMDFEQNHVLFTCHLFEKQLDNFDFHVRWNVTDTWKLFHCMYPEVFTQAKCPELAGLAIGRNWFTHEWGEKWSSIYHTIPYNRQRRISLFTEILKKYGSRTGVMREVFGVKKFELKHN